MITFIKPFKLALLITISFFCIASQASENNTEHRLSPFSIALVVADVNNSAAWYVNNLGFKVYKEIVNEKHGVKIKFLKIEGFSIEIIQHQDAYNVDEYIPKAKLSTLKQGILKYGFLVNNIATLLKDLKSKNVPIYRELYEDNEFGYKYFFIKDYSGNKIQIFEKLEVMTKK